MGVFLFELVGPSTSSIDLRMQFLLDVPRPGNRSKHLASKPERCEYMNNHEHVGRQQQLSMCVSDIRHILFDSFCFDDLCDV